MGNEMSQSYSKIKVRQNTESENKVKIQMMKYMKIIENLGILLCYIEQWSQSLSKYSNLPKQFDIFIDQIDTENFISSAKYQADTLLFYFNEYRDKYGTPSLTKDFNMYDLQVLLMFHSEQSDNQDFNKLINFLSELFDIKQEPYEEIMKQSNLGLTYRTFKKNRDAVISNSES